MKNKNMTVLAVVVGLAFLVTPAARAYDFKTIPNGGDRVGIAAEANELYELELKLVKAYASYSKTNKSITPLKGGNEQNFKGLFETGDVGAIFALMTPSWWRTFGTGVFIEWTHRTLVCRYKDPVTGVKTPVRLISQGQAEARWGEFHTWVEGEVAQKIVRDMGPNFICLRFEHRSG
jgi:hypothetical protein